MNLMPLFSTSDCAPRRHGPGGGARRLGAYGHLGIGWFNGSEGLEWLHGFQWGALPASAADCLGLRGRGSARLAALAPLRTRGPRHGALPCGLCRGQRSKLYWLEFSTAHAAQRRARDHDLHYYCACLSGALPGLRTGCLRQCAGGRRLFGCRARPRPAARLLTVTEFPGERRRRSLQRHKARLSRALDGDPRPRSAFGWAASPPPDAGRPWRNAANRCRGKGPKISLPSLVRRIG